LILLCIYIPTLFFFSKRINEILKAKIDIIDGIVINYEKLGITQKIKGKIEFKNVSFKFLDSAVFCLKNINLTINPGETIGIIGPTGSGKTTLVNLIPRFFDPDEGEILINDINIKDYQINDLRNKIGYVMQRSNLLNRSIEKNIGLNYNILNSEVTFEQLNAIKNSAKISQAEKFIELLPEKYKTIISQNATNISGGQKQRLAIATAINKPHEILIFDDSFSALDYSTDVKLRKQLEKNFKDSTKIFISSRINTVIKADRIVYIENGVIKGIGNHKELFLKNIQYKQIVLNQISEMEALYEK
jgi:ATP-binding cassette subfamily B protein